MLDLIYLKAALAKPMIFTADARAAVR